MDGEKIETEALYTKDELKKAAKFGARKDALAALLEDGKSYTVKEAEEILKKFMKGSV